MWSGLQLQCPLGGGGEISPSAEWTRWASGGGGGREGGSETDGQTDTVAGGGPDTGRDPDNARARCRDVMSEESSPSLPSLDRLVALIDEPPSSQLTQKGVRRTDEV